MTEYKDGQNIADEITTDFDDQLTGVAMRLEDQAKQVRSALERAVTDEKIIAEAAVYLKPEDGESIIAGDIKALKAVLSSNPFHLTPTITARVSFYTDVYPAKSTTITVTVDLK